MKVDVVTVQTNQSIYVNISHLIGVPKLTATVMNLMAVLSMHVLSRERMLKIQCYLIIILTVCTVQHNVT